MRASLQRSLVFAGLLGALGACLSTNTPPGPGVFSHDNFFVVTGSHQNFTCDQCHPPGASSFSYAAGGVDCFGCHTQPDMDSFHSGISGYAFDFYQCLACHRTGTAVFDHSSFFPITAGTVHQSIACSSCHGATHAAADLQCATAACHPQSTTDPGHSTVTGYAYNSPACYSCHPTGTAGVPTTITVGGFSVSQPPATTATTQSGIANLPHPTLGAGETCSTCHANGIGAKHAAGYDHASPLISANCSSCHETGSDLVSTPWNGATGVGDTRPYDLALANPCNISASFMHFYPPNGTASLLGDCGVCHTFPSGAATTTTGVAYASAWRWHHPPKNDNTGTFPCSVCHVSAGCGD